MPFLAHHTTAAVRTNSLAPRCVQAQCRPHCQLQRRGTISSSWISTSGSSCILPAGLPAHSSTTRCASYASWTAAAEADTAHEDDYYQSDEEVTSSSEEEEEDTDQDRIEVHHVHHRLPLQAVALGDDGIYVVAYEDGDLAWSGGLPDGLYDDLTLTQRYKRQVDCVSFGRNQGSDTYATSDDSEEVWFMMRNTGTTYLGQWCDGVLRERWWNGEGDDRVVKVCFAPNDGWLCFKEGGGFAWECLPESLADHLNENWDDRGGVETMSVGHNGEWFVRYNNGSYVWCGVHPTLAHVLKKHKSRTGAVEWVELGPDGTFVALFERYTLWNGDGYLTDDLLACM